MKIVGPHPAAEPAWRKGPGPRLDVRNENPRSAGSTERSERRLVAIDADDGKAQRAQVAHVPSVAASDVENAPARPDQGGPATHPGRGRIDFMRVRGHGADYLAARALASPPRLVQHSKGISPWRSGHGTQH